MKPLPAVPLTEEDGEIWVYQVLQRWPQAIELVRLPLIHIAAIMADRMDAQLMHTRTHRQAFLCAVCWQHIAHEACTVDHEIRLRRPFHPNSLGALLRDALK